MPSFSKTSLEQLRSRIDLVEVLSPYVKLQRAGASYKALCPFHDEKSPSFVVQKGDTHYHCFGCGAHGDAIGFLMTHLRMTFVEAVEMLADKFQVHLEEVRFEEGQKGGPSKTVLKEALEKALRYYHFALLYTMQGRLALDYLYHRGVDLDFIKTFQIGFSPKEPNVFRQMMEPFEIEVLQAAGLLSQNQWEFFADRIVIPIRDALGAVIGFSGRKFKNETFGGKYVNTPETVLFKKSKVLFGLSDSRKRIMKERKALIVEGQLDALRLIHLGFNWTVAGQGTAFGEEHVKELIHLGVQAVYLALDGDSAGQEATSKIGHLFQKEGIEVFVVSLPLRLDPDEFLQEKGPEEWQRLLDGSQDYLSFLIQHLSLTLDLHSPAGKNELVRTIAKRIREWDHPLMVHESLKKLARLTQTPENLLLSEAPPQVHIQRHASVSFTEIDPDRILEADLLRWLVLMNSSELANIAKKNLQGSHFRHPAGRALYEKYMQALEENLPSDLLSLAIHLDLPEHQMFMAEVLQKKVNRERALPCFIETVQRILERHWMQEREAIKLKIYSGKCSEEEVLDLARKFDLIRKERPQVVLDG